MTELEAIIADLDAFCAKTNSAKLYDILRRLSALRAASEQKAELAIAQPRNYADRIFEYRRVHGCGLKEARDAVDLDIRNAAAPPAAHTEGKA